MCGKGFSKIKNLKKHVSKVHKVSSERYEDLVEIMTENDIKTKLDGDWPNGLDNTPTDYDGNKPNDIKILFDI